jgi:DNA primase
MAANAPHQSPAGFGDDRQRVLDATDIVRLISDHLALKPKGREYVALCPFHDDHSPSMCVVPSKQIYHCFSCGAGGNAIGFVMNYHKMGFRESLEFLAERAGLTLAPPTRVQRLLGESASGEEPSSSPSGSAPRARLIEANQTASTFFRAILRHADHGRSAREVIERRGISPEMVDAFQLGASPDKWDGLAMTIASKGLDATIFRMAGLLKARDSGGGDYDAFRNRLTFPIHDQIGRVIGFGGRRLNDDDDPKYLNSPESPIFDKSTTLYALHHAAQHIRRSRIAIVTEGYMDAIACHQAGFGNVVATLGTAMTPGNARVLKRLCESVILLFDGDAAGQKAAERAIEVFFAEPVDVRIAVLAPYTDAKDPDELLKRDGGSAVFRRVLDNAIDPLDLLFKRVRTTMTGQGVNARTKTIEDFVAKLVDLGLPRIEPLRQQRIVRQVAQIAGVDWETIVDAINQRKGRPRFRPVDVAPARPQDSFSPAELLLGCVLCDPTLALSLTEDDWALIEPDAIAGHGTKQIAAMIAELTINEVSPSLQAVLEHARVSELQSLATQLARAVEHFTSSSSEQLRRFWHERLAAARRSRAALGETEVKSGAYDATIAPARTSASTAENLERLRYLHRQFGADPRAVPKPPT